MFRITKAFANDGVVIYRVEGKITDENLTHWDKELNALINQTNGHTTILDFCQVWFINQRGLDMVVQRMSEQLYLLNCSVEIRNVMESMGLSERLI